MITALIVRVFEAHDLKAASAMLPIIEPIAPLLRRTFPIGQGWRYEPKLDGFRGTLYLDGSNGYFRSKTKREMRRFASLATSLVDAVRVKNAVIDGEIITVVENRIDFVSLILRGQEVALMRVALYEIVARHRLRGLPASGSEERHGISVDHSTRR